MRRDAGSCIFVVAVLGVVAWSCSRGSIADYRKGAAQIVGTYEFEGTNILTPTHDPSGVCAGLYAPHRAQQTIQITPAKDPAAFGVKYVESGESFQARLVSSGRLEAENVTGVVAERGGANLYHGVRSITIQNARWDIATGVYQEVATLIKDLPGMQGPACRFVDARIVGVKDPSHHWVKYEATANFPWDFPHGSKCIIGGGSSTYGYLGLAVGPTHNDLNIYVQGVGCTFAATSTDGYTFTANEADCPLDPVMSISRLGVVSWKFETFSLDLRAKRLRFLARATRKRDTGLLVDLCLSVDSSLAGDLPA